MRVRGSKRGAGMGGILALVLGTSVWLAPAAAADSYRDLGGCGFLGRSLCGSGGVNNGNRNVWSCDKYANGEGFRVLFGEINTYEGFIDDPDGDGGVCGNFATGSTVTWYQVCRKTKPLICRPRVFF